MTTAALLLLHVKLFSCRWSSFLSVKHFFRFLCFPACCFLDRQTVGVSAAGDFPGSRCYTPPCRRWEEAFHRCCELVFHLRSSQIISLCSLLSQLHSSVSETMVPPPKKVPEILSSRNHLKMTTVSVLNHLTVGTNNFIPDTVFLN